MSRQITTDARQQKSLSRFLCMVLRHKPEVVDLSLDEEGWVPVRDLVAVLRTTWKKGPVSGKLIERIVADDPKQRYEIDSRQHPKRIRATYGHSVDVRIRYPEVRPPEFLYHGTARRFLWRIFRDGLTPMGRQYVHLSDDRETAQQVGARRDREPTILVVMAARMEEAGHTFYETPGGLYLTALVPPEFLQAS